MTLQNKKILVGVTGGVAACPTPGVWRWINPWCGMYKACSLVNHFIKEGADVKVNMRF